MYGVSGASGKHELTYAFLRQQDVALIIGRHCCLLCNVTYKDMQTPPDSRTPAEPRSLQGLKRDLSGFMTIGGGDLDKAKQHNNVICPPLFDIPLDQVMILCESAIWT